MTATAKQITQNPVPSLEAIEGSHTPQGLREIRALLGDERHTPKHVYTQVLSERERTILCFAAGLKRTDIDKPFSQLSYEQRDALRKAVLELDEIVKAFTSANAMAPAKFYQGAKRTVTSGHFDPANQLPKQH
ncbi:hypothetical protein CWC05_03650 [Pseudoalteromonas ruthenica]|uniref:Uncharacterized protein n=1 Tax=Pseudoalteromonas ruthenica TaxID=151081 RepID=A0A5S3ZAB1_9GAMM|nr:hypothetical protein [Pseudoalteromonas ruthenica]TMP88537.1 hypothetical protein CWC05_03650 [Pseudoalteromonas ruthenica]